MTKFPKPVIRADQWGITSLPGGPSTFFTMEVSNVVFQAGNHFDSNFETRPPDEQQGNDQEMSIANEEHIEEECLDIRTVEATGNAT